MSKAGKKLQGIWATVGGLQMYARASVARPEKNRVNVVLVHGLGVSSHYMVPTAVELAPHCPVFAPDLPGFGRSEHPSHVLDIPEMADALDGWMEAVGLPSAAFIGNSLGCQVIVDLAVRYPHRVERAVLIGPTFDRAARASIWSLLRRAVLDGRWEPRSLSPIIIRDYLSAGLWRVALTLRHGLLDPIEEKLPLVKVPTMVVRGEHDAVVPFVWTAYVARMLPVSSLVVIWGSTHAVNFSSPAKLVRVALPFLFGQEK